MNSAPTVRTLDEADRRYRASSEGSRSFHARAERVFPGGTISSVRAFREYPLYARRAEGCFVYDLDGNAIVDFMNANASVLLGHAHREVTGAVDKQVKRGLAFQLPEENAVEFAELLQQRTPSLERMRFTCSGTEATMFAFRLARVATGRRRILLMDGCYHGFHDIGSVGDGPNRGDVTRENATAKPVAWGVSPRVADEVEFVQFNDLAGCRALFEEHPGGFAAVVVEPLLGAAGNIASEPGFLAGLRELCDRDGALLVFDETITYSISLGAAQGYYGVCPDLTTAGKPIANGMPLGVFGGRADIMALCEPKNGHARLQHSSSFAAHPLIMAAGIATLRAYDEDVVLSLDRLGEYARRGIRRILQEEGVAGQVTGLQHLFGIHLGPGPVRSYADVRRASAAVRAGIAYSLLSQGFLTAGHRGCVNAAMTTVEIDRFLEALRIALHEVGVAGSQASERPEVV